MTCMDLSNVCATPVGVMAAVSRDNVAGYSWIATSEFVGIGHPRLGSKKLQTSGKHWQRTARVGQDTDSGRLHERASVKYVHDCPSGVEG